MAPLQPSLDVLSGVVFGKSIRSHYAILHVGLEEREAHMIVRIHFSTLQQNPPTELRSFCRRCCKLGDLIQVKGTWDDSASGHEVERGFVINLISMESAKEFIHVVQVRKWSMAVCQDWQRRFRPKPSAADNTSPRKRSILSINSDAPREMHHGGKVGKRTQGDCIANFCLHLALHALSRESEPNDHSTATLDDWASASLSPEMYVVAMKALNRGSGVVDAAGGLGYVSMALGMKGVQSTVVDPRESVGKLRKKDRKVWNRILRTRRPLDNDKDDGVILCQPVTTTAPVPFHTLRAWFGRPPPASIDTEYRNATDREHIPVCGNVHDLIRDCSLIVALHPDEATDAVVELAVQRKTPFVVVPCCVFSRYFFNRRKPNSNEPVTTYEDLLDYLAAKHDSIRRTTLPFEGANIALWSVF